MQSPGWDHFLAVQALASLQDGFAHTDSQAKMVFIFLKDYEKQRMYNVAREAENTFWPFMKQYATPGFREFSPVRPQTSGEPSAASRSLARVPLPSEVPSSSLLSSSVTEYSSCFHTHSGLCSGLAKRFHMSHLILSLIAPPGRWSSFG